MKNLCTIEKSAIQYLCGLIRDMANVSEGIDDLTLRSDGTFSSVKIDTLLNTLKTDCNEYTDRLVANLSRLELKIATSESEITQPNIMYLYKPSGATSYEQYVVIGGTKVLLGTTDIKMSDYYTITQADAKFVLKTDFDSLKTKLTTHTDDTDIHVTSAEKTKWDKVTDKVDKTDIVDNLTSTDTDKPLSANQGKTLEDKKINKTDIVTALTPTPSAGQIYDAETINNIIKTTNYYYDSNVDKQDITKRKEAILNVLNKLNNAYNGISIGGLPYATFMIRYAQGYYNTYILTSYGSTNHTVEILEYSPYENYFNIWEASGSTGGTDNLSLRKSAQIFNNKDLYTLSYTFIDETKYKLNYLRYSIRNGICYMRVQVKCVSPSGNFTDVGKAGNMGIPYPETQEYKRLFEENGNTSCEFYIGTEYVQMRGGQTGRVYTGSFSYPIKIAYN